MGAIILRLSQERRDLIGKFSKFALVGFSGIFVNTAVLYLTHGIMGLKLAVSSILAIELSIVWNFFLNDSWSFSDVGRSIPRVTRFLRFNLSCIIGGAINISILLYLEEFQKVDYLLANLAGIAVATIWTFSSSVLWSWKDEVNPVTASE